MDYCEKVVNQARKTRGYLQKKSSGLISIWQKRYFIILENKLAYYSDETLTESKKSTHIQEINTIKVVEDTEFHLVTKKRVYELMADDEKTRDLWVASLNILITSIQKLRASTVSPVKKQQTSDNTIVSSSPPPRNKKSQLPGHFPPPMRKMTSMVEQKMSTISSQIAAEDFFHQVGLPKIGNGWEEEEIRNKVILVQQPRSCYFIISCKTLPKSHEDEDFLPDDLIHPYNFNTLYCLEFGKVQRQSVVEVCKCHEITSVEEERKSLVLVVGGRNASIDLDLKRLQTAELTSLSKRIQQSIRIGKEYYNCYNIKIRRNIDKMLHLYDSKEVQLAEIVRRQFEKCQAETKEGNARTEFRRTLENLKRAAKQISNCCDVLEKSRGEFKEKFVREFYLSTMGYINRGYGTLEKGLALPEQKKIIVVLYDFWKMVKEVVEDNRMYELSLGMHRRLMGKYQEEILSKIDSCFSLREDELLEEISIELKGETEIIEQMDTLFFSNSIYRQLHIDSRLVLYELPEMPINEHILQEYLAFFKNIFRHLAEQTFKFIDKWKSTELLLGTCNEIEFIKNTLFEEMYGRLTKDYRSMAGQILDNCIKEIESEICGTEILLVKKLFVHTSSTIERGMFNKSFDELNITLICEAIITKLRGLAKVNKYVRRNIFEASFEEICYFYYSSIVKYNRRKAPTPHNSEFFIRKMADDAKAISTSFQPHIYHQKIYAHLNDLALLKEFVQSDMSQSKRICQNLKKEFGNSFTEQALANLISLRDMNDETRECLALECNEIVKNSVDSVEEVSITSSSRESFLDNWNNARSRKSTLTVSLNEFYESQHTIHHNKYACSVWKQGYLLKKKMAKTSISNETRAFFKINHAKLEEYETDTSQKVATYYELNKVKRCVLHPQKNYIFFVEFTHFKLQFKAESSDEAREWIKNIFEEVGTLSTLKEIPMERDRHSQFLLPETHKELRDPSTMESLAAKERSREKSSGSPMLKKKKGSPDRQKEPLSPERILRIAKDSRQKQASVENSCHKCSKGFFF